MSQTSDDVRSLLITAREERDEAIKERDRERHRTDVVIAEFDAPWPHTHAVADRLSNSLVWQIHECRAGVEDRAERAESQLTALRSERDSYRTLAGIGAWHQDCRPNREMAARELAKSQAVIDKLADTISGLESQLTALTHERDELGERAERYALEAGDLTRRLMDGDVQIAALRQELERVATLLEMSTGERSRRGVTLTSLAAALRKFSSPTGAGVICRGQR